MQADDAMSGAEGVELVGHVLSAFVVVQALNLLVKLILCPSLERLEGRKCIGLLEQHDNAEASVIINEQHPIAVALRHRGSHKTTEVRVDEISPHPWSWTLCLRVLHTMPRRSGCNNSSKKKPRKRAN